MRTRRDFSPSFLSLGNLTTASSPVSIHLRTDEMPTPRAKAAAGTSKHKGVMVSATIRLVADHLVLDRSASMHSSSDDAPQIRTHRAVVGCCLFADGAKDLRRQFHGDEFRISGHSANDRHFCCAM